MPGGIPRSRRSPSFQRSHSQVFISASGSAAKSPVSNRNFFAELRRRNVYRIAAAYAFITWVVIQVATIVFPAFNAPLWVVKVIICLLALGFPIAVALAWAFEITPAGIKRSDEFAPEERGGPHRGRKLITITILAAIIAIGLFLFRSERGQQLFASVVRSAGWRSHGGGDDANSRSIAVLPFDNMSGESTDAFLPMEFRTI